jgi:PE family
MSSHLNASPEGLASASAGLSGVGEAIREATSAAAPSTTSIVPAAADEVSAAITRLFGRYGQEFQALSAQTAAIHARFVQLLFSGGAAYAAAEAANTDPLWGDGGAGGSGGKAIGTGGTGGAGGANGLIGGGNGGAGGFIKLL